MKKLYSLFAIAAIALYVNAQTTYVWDGSSVSPNSGTDVNISAVAFNASQGNNKGTTNMISTSSASFGYAGASGTSNFGAAAFTGALSTNSSTYFSLTISPAIGYKISLNSFSLGSRGTGTGPTTISIYSSIDNYASAIGTTTVLSNSTWALSNISLSGLTVGVVSTPVTIRIYGGNGVGTNSSNIANWRIDDIALNVSASPVSLAVSDLNSNKLNLVKNTVVHNTLQFNTKANLQIVNMVGQVVKNVSVNEKTVLDVSFLAKGTYLVSAVVSGKKLSQKITKD